MPDYTRFDASQKLATAAENILEREFFGDRSKYAEALSLAGKRNRGALADFLEPGIVGDEPDTQPRQGRAMAAAADKVLAEKFGGDASKYAEAMLEVERQRPELFADYYDGVGGEPDPAYTRLLSPELEAKSRLDPTAEYPTWPDTANPKPYDPRGLIEQKVLTFEQRAGLVQGLKDGQFKTYGDVVKFMLAGNAAPGGVVVVAGPSDATAVSGARVVKA